MPYAFLLDLDSTTSNAPPRNLSQYAHGLFYHLLETIDPVLSKQVHAAKRVPFSLSGWSENSSVRLRIATLDDTLFRPLLHVLISKSVTGLELGQHAYQITRVFATPEGDRNAGVTSWPDLLAASERDRVTLRFLTPTVFTTSRSDGKRHYTPLPEPRLVFKSLLATFQAHSPEPYSNTERAALAAVFDEQLILTHFEIRTKPYRAGKNNLTGFVGTVQIAYPERTREVKRAFGRLAELAFYSGVGAKTSYGMGQVRLEP